MSGPRRRGGRPTRIDRRGSRTGPPAIGEGAQGYQALRGGLVGRVFAQFERSAWGDCGGQEGSVGEGDRRMCGNLVAWSGLVVGLYADGVYPFE